MISLDELNAKRFQAEIKALESRIECNENDNDTLQYLRNVLLQFLKCGDIQGLFLCVCSKEILSLFRPKTYAKGNRTSITLHTDGNERHRYGSEYNVGKYTHVRRWIAIVLRRQAVNREMNAYSDDIPSSGALRSSLEINITVNERFYG